MAEENNRSEIIVDDEIRLLQLREDNVDALFELVDRNREHLLQWFPERYVYWDKGQVWEDISPKGVMRTHSPSTIQLGIWYLDKLAGVITVHPNLPDGATYFLGYWVGTDFQGRGIVTRSVKALLDKLFELEWVQKVEIHCAVENTKSQAIPRRLGFFEGVTIHNAELVRGKPLDDIIFSMPRMKWLGEKHPLVAKWRARKRQQ